MKGQDEQYSDKELTGLRQAISEATTTRDAEAVRLQHERDARERQYRAATARVEAGISTAQESLEGALAHNARAAKREAHWVESVVRASKVAQNEEELRVIVSQDMATFQ